MKEVSTKEHILVIAKALFQKQGYAATGITQILRAADIPKGSLYHFFSGGKEELLIESIKATLKDNDAFLTTLFKGIKPGISRIYKLLEEVGSYESYDGVVPFALIALETAEGNENIRQHCEQAYRYILNRLAKEFEAEGMDSERAYQLAGMIESSLEGALVFVHTFKDKTYIKTTVDNLKRLIDLEMATLKDE